MSWWKRVLGICDTRRLQAPDSWRIEGRDLVLDLQRIAELRHPSGAVRLEGKGLAFRVLIVHGSDGRFHAFENRCTHMGRRIDPLPGANRVQCCSVSKSTFDYGGRPVSGAARNPIRVFETRQQDGLLFVHLDPAAG